MIIFWINYIYSVFPINIILSLNVQIEFGFLIQSNTLAFGLIKFDKKFEVKLSKKLSEGISKSLWSIGPIKTLKS